MVLLMSLELLLLSVNTNFIAFAKLNGNLNGQIAVFFILTVAAAEVAIGLAMLVLVFRQYDRSDAQDLKQLKG